MFFCLFTVTGSFFKKSYHIYFSSAVMFFCNFCAFDTKFLLYL